MPEEEHLLFDVVVPTYNNLAGLKACLGGFEAQRLKSFRVWVCVDGSTDGSLAYLETARFSFPMEVLTHPDGQNHGRNATRNLILGRLSGQYLAFVDSDTVPEPGFLQAHLDMLQKLAPCASVGKLYYTNAKTNIWARYVYSRGKAKYAHDTQIPFQYFTTGNAAIPAHCFTELDGQDPAMRTYGGGDTEFAWRLWQRFQMPVYYNTHAVSAAEMEKSLDFALNQMYEFGSINLPHVRKKHPEFKEIYHIGLLTGKGLKSRLLRALLNPLCAWGVRRVLLPISFGKVELACVHYLAIYQMYMGWLAAEAA